MRRVRQFVHAWGYTLLLACVLILGLCVPHDPTAVFTDGALRPVLILDAGHGLPDGGAVAPDGTDENALNLDITNRLCELLFMLGKPAVRTRTTLYGLWSADCTTIREKKISDMRYRTELVNSYPRAVLLSVHQNSYAGNARGGQVYVRDGQSSRALGACLADMMALREDIPTRPCATMPDGLYLFENTKCPAVIVEAGYLSHGEDLAALCREEYREWLAAALACGYLQWEANT